MPGTEGAVRAALLERLLAAVPGGVVYVDAAGLIRLANDEALRVGGLSREDVVGKPAGALGLELADESGLPLAPEDRPFARVLATGAEMAPRTLAFRLGAHRGWAVFRAVPLDMGDGGPRGVVISFVDLTARKQAEEELRAAHAQWRTIAANLPDTVVITDAEARIDFSNHYVPGIGPAEVLGRHAWEFVEPEHREAWRRHFADAMSTGQSVRFDTIGRSGGRGTAWYETVLVPLVEDESPRRMVVLARDVTESRTLLARVAEHDRLASLGLVAASVAHEIMNPLTYVLVNLELATSGRLRDPERTSRALVDALEGARRMEQIVRDLRSLGRSGSEELFYVEVRSIVETAVRLAGPELAHAARLEVELADEPAVLANESRLCQVFINLLVNAAQAVRDRPEGTIRVRSVQGDDPALAGVAISDTGPGIPQEQQELVFAPFFTTKTRGAGLGLSITRDIVSRMGGRVEVASPAGGGATFTVWLPTGSRAPAPAP